MQKDFNLPPPELPASPAISVIVPMYNMEKYIGDCLESLLAQTFSDFEVIVIDDCSTDTGVKIVNDYVPKFGGRLAVVRMEKNSGYAGFPRNKGIELAGGEYLYFLDSDDTIAPTALEELHSLAKKFNADVVHCEKYYLVPDEFYNDAEYRKNLKPYSWPMTEKTFITQPTLLTNDFEKRVREFSQKWLQWASWQQLIRRDFLLDNGIRFLNTYSQDLVFTMCEICCARNYLVVPNVLYYWRKRSDSKTQEKMDTPQAIHRYVSILKQGVNYLDEFLNRQRLFAKRTDLKYILFDTLFTTFFSRLDQAYKKVSAHELYELLRKEFDSDSVFTAFLFNALNIYRLNLDPPREPITEPTVEVLPPINEAQDFTPKEFPAISVAIPMYNVEKYVGECLDSLLAQTFQNFEVIVVDDCSTDNSRAVVESYMSKFDGRLSLVQLEENTGYAGFPRNKGIELARGEYIYFLDPDDTITPTALEELYSLAKKFNADVVHCEKYYLVPDELYNDAEYRKTLKPYSWPTFEKIYITQPALLSNDFEKRVRDFGQRWLQWASWMQFIRRDFLLDNGIRFLNIYSQDMIFIMCELCCAKNYLVVPNVFYYWRQHNDSKTKKYLDANQKIKMYVEIFKQGLKYLDEFLSRQEFFAKRTDLKYILFDMIFGVHFSNRLGNTYRKVQAYELDELLRKEIGGENSAFTAFTFNAINIYLLQLNPSPKRIVVSEMELEHISNKDDDAFLLNKIPAVSVIIPLYNAEKYVSECLDSLLAQTFQDFEVIVVDDCSTDSSVEIVESYREKFNGRLTLTNMEKNSGSSPAPRNKGLTISRGEYVFFIDNDDLLLKNAFEEMYSLAKEYDADLLYVEKHYEANADLSEIRIRGRHAGGFVETPTFETEDLTGRLKALFSWRFGVPPWIKFTKRNLLLENEIFFPHTCPGEDDIWTYSLIFYAKKILRVPNAVYIHRISNDSITGMERIPQHKINLWINPLILGLKNLDKLIGRHEFFKSNPQYRYGVLAFFVNAVSNNLLNRSPIVEPFVFYETIKQKFGEKLGDYDVLICALCTVLYDEKKYAMTNRKVFRKFMNYISARIDIQFKSKEQSNLQIVSVSDKQANVNRSAWLKGNEVGYFIQSYAGSLKLVAKATSDGTLRLYLLGMDVRDPKDNTKRIPYWIDYTSLTVNGKKIFDKITPAWHDKSYNYRLDVKANEEIEVQVDWLPHRSDVPAVATPQVKPLADKFLPYITGRVDIQMSPKAEGGDLKILSISDDKTKAIRATWLKGNNIGYMIQSYVGKLKIVAKATSDGQVRLFLLGMDVRDPKNNAKRIPYWIDYTSLTVNGKKIFDTPTPVWHDKGYRYILDAKAGDEITLQVEWLPHRSDVPEVAPPPPPPPEKVIETVVEKVVEPIADKFLPYLTGRSDIQLTPESGTGDLQIISVSDKKADVTKAFWLPKNEIGYAIQSRVGNMEIVAKVTADGQFNLKLRGMWVQDPADDSKLIPYRIDYTKLAINGKVIFDTPTTAWHDEPFDYTFDVNADEEITVSLEWLPHMSNT